MAGRNSRHLEEVLSGGHHPKGWYRAQDQRVKPPSDVELANSTSTNAKANRARHTCTVHTQLPVSHRSECKQNNVLEVPLHNSMSQQPGSARMADSLLALEIPTWEMREERWGMTSRVSPPGMERRGCPPHFCNCCFVCQLLQG